LLRDLGNVAAGGETLVSALYQDRSGVLWIGSSSGLSRLDPGGRPTFHSRGEHGVSAGVLSIAEDRSGNLWLGTVGEGVKRLDRRTQKLKTYMHHAADPGSLSDDLVPRLLFDRSGTLWAATWDGLNKFDPLTESFQLYKVDPNSRTERYHSLAEDQEGALWLGSDSGLVRFDPKSAGFVTFKHIPGVAGSISNNRVNSVFVDHTGQLWIGTQNGLNKFSRADGTFTPYAEHEGLRGNAVSCVLEDRLHNLWMSTNRGISRFDPRTTVFSNYSSADGLRGGDLTGWGTCFQSPSGELFFGGFSGAFAFNPEKVVDSPLLVPVVLTDFRLFGGPSRSERTPLSRNQ
jgi:ligand-binding sensor domain-containing protein